MSIKKVVKSSVSQQVFDQLREQILSGGWKSGDKLPSENELAAQFGVSRVTVRNALQKLSGLGLIETRFGEGSFVRGPEAGAALNQLVPMLYLGRETLRDILTFRRMVEGPICEIACRRATDREIAQLRQLLDEMERAEVDLPAFARLDSAFHGMVARLTRSNMMQQIYQIIDDAMQSATRQHVRQQSVQVALGWYRKMLAAFEARDSARARRAMEQALAQTFWISTVYQNVLNMESAWPERVAVRWYDEAAGCVREVRYRDYAADIRRMVGYLRRNLPGIEGRHIGLLDRTGYPYAVALFGCILAGAVAVPLNYEKSWPDLADEIARADVDCLLAGGAYREREPGFAGYSGRVLDIGAFAGCTEQAELTECLDRDAPALILFTSDTTGRSKGVVLSQRNLFAPMRLFTEPFATVRRQFGLPEDYQFSAFSVLPLFHVAALTSLLSWSISGNAVNFCADLRRFYRDLAAMPSDVMAVVPTLLKSIHHDVCKGKAARLGKLRIFTCGAATYDPQMLADLIERGFTVIQTYGLTETVGDGGWNSAQDPAHLASVGLRDPDMEYRLEDGELCMKGEAVMLGYYKDPEATEAVLKDGWFHTGDLARIDEDGYIYLTGRKNNLMILPSGENVSPEELEALLAKIPPVREVLVCQKEGKICARISCREAAQDQVRAFIHATNRMLPLYKRVAAVEFTDQPLPRNALGKLQRG